MLSCVRLLFSIQPLRFILALICRILKFMLMPLLMVTSRSTNSSRSGSTSSLTSGSFNKRPARGSLAGQQQQDASATLLYDEYNIVCEQFMSVNANNNNNNIFSSNGGGGNSFSATRAWIDGKEWEFSAHTKNNTQHTLRLTLLELDWRHSNVDAEICFWHWQRGKQIQILQRGLKSFQQKDSYVQFQFSFGAGNSGPSDGHFYLLLRLLDRRQQPLENFCNSSVDEEGEDFVKLIVGAGGGVDSCCLRVSKHYLMTVSPVFHKMFSTENEQKLGDNEKEEGEEEEGEKEKEEKEEEEKPPETSNKKQQQQQNEFYLEGTNTEAMKQFLEAIFPSQTHPNPYNVFEMLKLANRFQVDFLRTRCESHLIHCVEMPLMERLICADSFHLDKLKNYILKSLTGAGLREFYDENHSAMHLLGMELLIQLTQRICSSVKRLERASLCQTCQKGARE